MEPILILRIAPLRWEIGRERQRPAPVRLGAQNRQNLATPV